MEKIKRYIIIFLFIVLLATTCFLAVNMARVRQDLADAERRNNELILSNSQYAIILDSIAGRISEAQKNLAGTGDTISRIRGLVDAIERISQDLRKLAPQN